MRALLWRHTYTHFPQLHHIFKLVLGGRLFRAPVEAPLQKVLDFGTGTGIWAIDLAEYTTPSAVAEPR